MATQKQLGFQILEHKNVKKYFGGSYLGNSNPKGKRPLTAKRSIHLVLRSTFARGQYSLLRKERVLRDIVFKHGKKFGVRIYNFANGGNHLHLVILPRSREAFHSFIRSISGLVAREILGVKKGSPLKIKFWDKRPFTRIVEWGREFRTLLNYLDQNALEAWGFIPFKNRVLSVKNINSG